MRVIKYNVEGQLISPTNSTKGIYAGSENYLELEFTFNKDWNDCVKAIVFVLDGYEHSILLNGNKCLIPNAACNQRFIRFYLVGKNNEYRIQTRQTRIGVNANV